MIQARAKVEINKSTHSTLLRPARLDSHYPALNEGEIVTITSSRRSLSAVKCRIESLTIEATIGEDKNMEISDRLEVIEFKDFKRQ